MDKLNKINEIKKLRDLIKEKELLIEKESKEVKLLKEQLNVSLNESKLPILLFSVNETFPDENVAGWKYENIYYFPDLDEVKYTYYQWSRENEFLPNTIDLRNYFESVDIPKKLWPWTVQTKDEYRRKVDVVALCLKEAIDNIFNNYQIESWEELGMYLNGQNIEKVTTKVLKKINL